MSDDTLGAYYRNCPIAKPQPRCVTKRRQEKLDAKAERECRAEVKRRDKGKCQIPGCTDRAVHQHHIEYRSRAKGKRFEALNRISLCPDHHRLVHAREIHLSRAENEELIVRGNIDLLRFRL